MNLSDILSKAKEFIELEISFGKIHINLTLILLFILALVLAAILSKLLSSLLSRHVLNRLPMPDKTSKRIKRITQVVLFVSSFVAGLALFGFDMSLVGKILKVLNTPIDIGDSSISINSIIVSIILISISVYIARLLSNLLMTKGLSRTQIDIGTKYVLKRVTEYALIIIGGIIAFQIAGIDLSGLAVIFGLLSVGIGFGLQNIASNFISGIILLFERPIQVGDRITVGDTDGDVEEINIRATTIRSLDNISIIVPNTEFVEGRVTNWSHGDLKVRMNVDVGVSYNSDLQNVLSALREVADENEHVLQEPKPEVLLMEFGDSSWNMQLRVWIADPKDYYRMLSSLNCAIVDKFRARNIEIPFPQRDLHVRSSEPIPLEKK